MRRQSGARSAATLTISMYFTRMGQNRRHLVLFVRLDRYGFTVVLVLQLAQQPSAQRSSALFGRSEHGSDGTKKPERSDAASRIHRLGWPVLADVYDRYLQATHRAIAPAWTGRSRSPRGDRWWQVWASFDQLDGLGAIGEFGRSRRVTRRRVGSVRRFSNKGPGARWLAPPR